MTNYDPKSLRKLNKLLSKRYNRPLSNKELEVSYAALINFGKALLDLDDSYNTIPKPTNLSIRQFKIVLETRETDILHYV
jgi:hypothetical protein